MTDAIVDFRSDTVTRPTPGMRQVMAEAVVGDDVKDDDPTAQALEAAVAKRMGKAAGLFFPSGTQSNLAAILAHCGRGEEVIAGDSYHVLRYEAGGASALGGVATQPIRTAPSGALDPASVREAVKPDDKHFPVTRLLSLENATQGAALPIAAMTGPAEAAREAGLAVHLDGARIFNAALALGAAPADIAAPADTVSVCLSKGLGAPIGTVLCGAAPFIARARRIRHLLGGGMRQVGIIAAAGLYALEHHIDRLAEDHARARHLSDTLAGLPGVTVRKHERPTNMVFLSFDPALEPALRAALAERGVLIAQSDGGLRLALHLDIDDAGLERAIDGFRAFFRTHG